MKPLEFENGDYRTAARRVSLLASWFPSLAFHAKFLWIVLCAGMRAKWRTYSDDDWVNSSLSVIRALESVGVRLEITGREHLEQVNGACLVIGNHMSSLETTVLPAVIQPVKKVTFVVKQQLLDYPVFKHVMRSRDPIGVTQTDPRADLKRMLHGGAERLERGTSLVIFPEGERKPRFEPQNFNSIGVKIASRSGSEIVPLALETSAWGIGRLISELGKIDTEQPVRFAFGPSLTVEGRGKAEQDQLVEYIQSHLARWAAEDQARRDR